jgi:membrane fusion protein, multidrug efflux system
MKKLTLNSNKRLVAGSILAVIIVVGGIYQAGGSDSGSDSAAQGAPAATPVVVKTMKEEKIRAWTEFSGRIEAVDSAEIRPEVSGRITKILFEDGQNVKAGDVIMVIDPRPYEAAVTKAEANLASAKTNADFAKVELERATEMLKSQAIAQRIYDERANASRISAANVKAADAELKQARLNLEYANVKAPISGRISRAEITVGNLVQAGPTAPLLTTIVSNETVYADFEVDEQTYVKSIRSVAEGSEEERKVPVTLELQGDKKNTYKGKIYSFDNKIDVTSGTIRARAKFDNPDGTLIPGMFVSISMADGSRGSALLIPERAIGYDQNKKFVYVVNKENKVEYRPVELGRQIKAERVVISGLKEGERVVTDGVQHIRPDALVEPKEQTEKQDVAKQ